jgi:UDP-glucose 6-dehydrogenase
MVIIGSVCPMRISVIDVGYVGLVSSVCFPELGRLVSLVEIDPEMAESINLGKPLMHEY